MNFLHQDPWNMIIRCLLLLCIVSAWVAPSNAQTAGSGSLSGTFLDNEDVQPAVLQIVPYPSSNTTEWVNTPAAAGDGTDQYTWGLFGTGRFFLDGLETTQAEIDALNLSAEELAGRAGREVGPSDNLLRFVGSNFVEQAKGEPFVAGKLFFNNGVSWSGATGTTNVKSVQLEIASASADPDFQQMLPLAVNIVTTPNTGNPEADADFIYFRDRPDLGSFRVLEGEATDVEIVMEFNSLHLLGFGAVGDPSRGFVSPTIPEPASMLLLAIGLPAILLGRGRRWNLDVINEAARSP